MAEYLVLARKYRSATFEEVVGQEHVAATLVHAIESGRVAHAFLFTGTRGVGKTTVARILAKALNCLSVESPTPKPCNECDACRSISRGDDVDVVEIDGASNRGIEEIRELRANAIYRPTRCRYKVYYIDEVHMLTREAFNALLKTLEEPPEHVKFIFATTEPERLPATIISRCQRFDFRNIPTSLIAEHLGRICRAEKVQVEEGAIFRIARAAAGSMRDGLSLLDQLLAGGEGTVREADVVRILGTPAEQRTETIVAAVAASDPAATLTALDSVLSDGVSLESVLTAVGEMFRNMMLARVCGPETELIELPDSQRKTVVELSEKFSLPALVQAVNVCQTTARNLGGLSSGRALVEAALVRLAAAEKFVDAASLVERLEKLAGGAPVAPAPAGRTGPARSGARMRQKKKPLAPAPAAPAPEPQATPAVLDSPRWEQAYLAEHWSEVVSAMARERNGHISGLLAPAKVLEVSGETLRLGYAPAHEPIRRRAVRNEELIAEALAKIFQRSVRCEYVAVEGADAEAPPLGVANLAVSSAQRAEVAADPAVRAVLDFFDGSIINIVRTPPSAQQHPDEGD